VRPFTGALLCHLMFGRIFTVIVMPSGDVSHDSARSPMISCSVGFITPGLNQKRALYTLKPGVFQGLFGRATSRVGGSPNARSFIVPPRFAFARVSTGWTTRLFETCPPPEDLLPPPQAAKSAAPAAATPVAASARRRESA